MRVFSLIFTLVAFTALSSQACMVSEKRAKELLTLYKKDDKALWDAVQPDRTDPNNLAWNCDLTNIAKGNRKWLEVAVLLHKHADETAAKSLDMAVGEALLKNPEAVLKLADRGFPPEDICIVPYVDPHPDLVKGYVEETKKILETVSDPALLTEKNKCIHYLEKALK